MGCVQFNSNDYNTSLSLFEIFLDKHVVKVLRIKLLLYEFCLRIITLMINQ